MPDVLSGVDPGDYNGGSIGPDVNGEWAFVVTSVEVAENDTLYYWYHIVFEDHGCDVTNQ